MLYAVMVLATRYFTTGSVTYLAISYSKASDCKCMQEERKPTGEILTQGADTTTDHAQKCRLPGSIPQ